MFWKEVLPTVKINQQIPGHLLTGKLLQGTATTMFPQMSFLP